MSKFAGDIDGDENRPSLATTIKTRFVLWFFALFQVVLVIGSFSANYRIQDNFTRDEGWDKIAILLYNGLAGLLCVAASLLTLYVWTGFHRYLYWVEKAFLTIVCLSPFGILYNVVKVFTD